MIISGENTVVTLKDSAGDGSYVTRGIIATVIDGATLNIESGYYESTGDNAFWAGRKNATGTINVGTAAGGPEIVAQEDCIAAGKDSTIVVNNGTFTSKDNAVLASNGSAGYEGAKITVNDGYFFGHIETNGYTGCGVYFPNDGELTINGGKWNIDGVGVCARAGKVNVKGGEFVSTVDTAGWVGDKKTQVPAYGVVFDGAAKYPGLAEGAQVNITGGTFTNTANADAAGVMVTQPDNGITVGLTNTAGWREPLL